MPSTSSPSTSSSPTAPPTPPLDPDAARKQQQAAAAQRYAEVSLKSVPLPPGVDPNKRATVGEAARTIKPEDFTKVHEAPCTREGLLTGIGSGAAVGFLRYIAGAPIPKSSHWAVGSGVAASVIAYEYCQYQRRVERANMKRVVQVVTKKQADQKKAEEERRARLQAEKAEKEREAAALQAAAKEKSWYRFW